MLYENSNRNTQLYKFQFLKNWCIKKITTSLTLPSGLPIVCQIFPSASGCHLGPSLACSFSSQGVMHIQSQVLVCASEFYLSFETLAPLHVRVKITSSQLFIISIWQTSSIHSLWCSQPAREEAGLVTLILQMRKRRLSEVILPVVTECRCQGPAFALECGQHHLRITPPHQTRVISEPRITNSVYLVNCQLFVLIMNHFVDIFLTSFTFLHPPLQCINLTTWGETFFSLCVFVKAHCVQSS